MAAEDEANAGPALPLFSSKRFPQPIKFPFTAYCDIHDLLAIVTSTWDVSVFRITSGQLAFTVKRKSTDCEITSLSWKVDGRCLGVGWTDGTYAIYEGGTGKELSSTSFVSSQEDPAQVADWKLDLTIRRTFTFDDDDDDDEEGAEKVPPARVEVMGWMSHRLSKPKGKKLEKSDPSTEDWFDGLALDDVDNPSYTTKENTPTLTDLTRAITTLDVTQVFPRLSAIPNHPSAQSRTNAGSSSSKWQTQQGTDSLLQTQRDYIPSVDVQSLLVCQDDGTVQVLLDETVKIGACKLPGKPLAHAAHSRCSNHAILSKDEDGQHRVSFVDLPLATLGGSLLHVITTNTKRIQVLLDYIQQVTRCIQFDYTSNMDLPARFLRSLGGFVEGSNEGGIVAHFFHLALTGSFTAQMLEWMTDVIQDRGWKRWDEAVNNLYTNVQDHLFIHLLPALDRFSIAATTLRGHAAFYEGSSKFDCPPEIFTNLLDKIDSMRLAAQKMLLIVQTEHRQFRAFSKWFKMQIDVAMAEPFSSTALENESREVPSLDYSLLLTYIKDILLKSELSSYIEDQPGMKNEVTRDEFWQNLVIQSLSYERAKEALKSADDPKPSGHIASQQQEGELVSVLNLPALACALAGHVRVALERITAWQSRMLLTPISTAPLSLHAGEGEVCVADMTMDETGTTRILMIHLDTTLAVLTIEALTSFSNNPPAAAHEDVPLPSGDTNEILSAKWIPHTPASILYLCKISPKDPAELHYALYRRNTAPPGVPEDPLHVFSGNASFKPTSLIVGGRKGKVVCVVFGNKGREWRVLDLDAGMKGSGREHGDGRVDMT